MKDRIIYVVRRLIPLLLVVAVTLALSGGIYQALLHSEQEACNQTLANTAATISDLISVQLTDNISTLQLAAGAMVQKDRVESREAIVQHIDAFQPATLFSRIDVLYADGTLLLQTGETQHVDGQALFEAAANGPFLSARTEDLLTGRAVVFCCVPVVHTGTVPAMLVGVIDCATLTDYFGTKAYGGQAATCIVNIADGDFLMDDRHDTLGNMYEMNAEPRQTLRGYEDVDLIGDVQAGLTGEIAYISNKNGQSSYIYYTPVGVAGWELLIVAQEQVAFAAVDTLKHYLIFFTLIETLMICLYLVWAVRDTDQLRKGKADVEAQLRVSSTLNDCARELADHTDVDAAVNRLLEIIAQYFNGDRAYIFKIDYDAEIVTNTYEYAAEGVSHEIDNLQSVPLDTVSAWIDMFRARGSFLISDIDRDVDGNTITYDLLAIQHIHSLLAVPLLQGSEIVGFLGVDNPRADATNPELLDSLRFFVVEALNRRDHQHTLEKLSTMDSMTQVFNRSRFNRSIEECKTLDCSCIAIACFDVNNLKATNDRLGHEAGDRLLITAADAIRATFPEHTFRIGDDEFAVLWPDAAEESFAWQITALKTKLSAQSVNVSCGTALCTQPALLEESLKLADSNMCAEKQAYHAARSAANV